MLSRTEHCRGCVGYAENLRCDQHHALAAWIKEAARLLAALADSQRVLHVVKQQRDDARTSCVWQQEDRERLAHELSAKQDAIAALVTERDALTQQLAASQQAVVEERERCITEACAWCDRGHIPFRGRDVCNRTWWCHQISPTQTQSCDADKTRERAYHATAAARADAGEES